MIFIKFNDRTGEISYSDKYGEIKIIKYINSRNIDVLFKNTNTIVSGICYNNFKKGTVFNPDFPSFYNKGFIGVGEYNSTRDRQSYVTWTGLIKRVYGEKYRLKHNNYKDVVLCDEWHSFQNFTKWFYENIYEIPSGILQLDKDIIVKNNKLYSPDTCCLVSNEINAIFIKDKNSRNNLPIGVNKHASKYMARIKKNNKCVYLGMFETPEEGFYAYKKEKEAHIKNIAIENKNIIPSRIYDAMMKYTVDIDD